MSEYIRDSVTNRMGVLTLDRPAALNALSIGMIRAMTRALLAWRENPNVDAVLVQSSSERSFCAGGDIRFLYEAGRSTPETGSPAMEDFFTEEYILDHLIHHYPKPYISLMDGIVMGGGMGIGQNGTACRTRIVTERTKMAMPEVKIGMFPDVGGSYFLSRTPGQVGTYLGVAGEVIGAVDALYAGLADVFIPSPQLPALMERLKTTTAKNSHATIREFAAPFQAQAAPDKGIFAVQRVRIERHFSHDSVPAIMTSLEEDAEPFAQQTLAAMKTRSPLMMCVTLEQIRRGATMLMADCLRMERSMVRYCYACGEVLEGIRAMVIAKDHAPRWTPAALHEVTPEMVESFFHPVWPGFAHPLRDLQ